MLQSRYPFKRLLIHLLVHGRYHSERGGGDTFLDRLVALTAQSADAPYRQKLVDDYRNAANATIPLHQAVAYDQQILQEVRSGSGAEPP